MKRLILGLVAATFSLTVMPSAQAASTPSPGAVFNSPQGTTTAKYRIAEHILDAVDASPRGSVIHIVSYLMDYPNAVTRLVAARNRGVGIQIVFDGDVETPQSANLAARFNRDNLPPVGSRPTPGPDNSFVYFCQGSCRGGGRGNMHTKFYLFSQSGAASDVVMVGSANLNKGGAVGGWNDMYTVVGRSVLYQRFVGVFNEMSEDTANDHDPASDFTVGRYRSRFFPRTDVTHATDPVIQDLADVGCRTPAGRNGRTLINISMFRISDTRGRYIVDRLLRLARDGCDVNIIYGAPSREMATYLKPFARRGLIRLYDSRWDRDRDGVPELRTHEKYMLINGRVGNDPEAHIVHNGSMNWGVGSLTAGDELLFTIYSTAWTSYYDNWNFVRSQSRRVL
jgi:phosphatidylserine/phosphatidylglycerophosphate/cardiolipin synthase-like enzyme